MYKSKILSIGSAFPEKQVTNHDLAKIVETDDAWITERTGIKVRHIADHAKGETNSELAFRATQIALKRAHMRAEDIELILYATLSPDYILPNTACVLQEKLNARHAAALDISAACSGFIYGLSIADAYIRIGQFQNVLLIGSEVLSPFINWKDRSTCILFGDASGAAIITRAKKDEASQIYSTHLYADGWLKDYLYYLGSGTGIPLYKDVPNFLQMKGREIYKVAVKMLSDCALKALEKNNFQIKDVDWLLPHQANLRIIETVAKKLDIPMEKVIINIDECANTSAATIPTALDKAFTEGKIKRGDLILCNVFGAGLTYGSALLRW